ncbi:hypothetical protein D3C84_724970 [compost metagenome]
MLAHLISEFMAGVLAALIRMKQHLFWPASELDRHSQRFAGQRGIGNHRKRPAHNPASEQIQNCRKVQPARADFDVRHIATPHLIDRCNIKLALEHMRRHQCFHAGRFVLVPPALTTGNARFAHQATRHMPPDTMPLGLQLLGQRSRTSR